MTEEVIEKKGGLISWQRQLENYLQTDQLTRIILFICIKGVIRQKKSDIFLGVIMMVTPIIVFQRLMK